MLPATLSKRESRSFLNLMLARWMYDPLMCVHSNPLTVSNQSQLVNGNPKAKKDGVLKVRGKLCSVFER